MDQRDEALADQIRSYFWVGDPPPQGFPWKRTEEVSYVPQFRNRTTSRIVIFSDHPNADGIKFAFNSYDLLGEPVDQIDMNFAEEKQKEYDIAVVVFPKR